MASKPFDEEDIFKAACKIGSPEARADYLKQACGDDRARLDRLAALLRVHDEEQSFLESTPPGLASTVELPLPAERPGQTIGRYKLLEEVGEGGMGTVWMAEQIEPVQRKVALKLIKVGMDSRQVVARFEAERQALALMDHPNIAKVFDGGTTASGRPFFAMELVKGVPITKYCDEHRLTPRERLELFLPVCQAIQHAHQRGIIHRDIKPSNVLVAPYDGRPVPKVIDFGVAKAIGQRLTARTLFTGFGALVGTLEYMSPEQAELNNQDVDTRSDIYSLGVLLYELLTGSTPLSYKLLKEAAYGEILHMIKEEEPPKPSTRLSDSGETLASISAQRHMEPAKLTKLVRGELDWIVMKTLEKDRNRRYETANGFAADVQRYLNDEAVQACPPTALYRFRKFTRRNKRVVAMVTVVSMAVLVATTTLGWALRDRQAREREIALETGRKLALTQQGIRQAIDRGTKSGADLHAILKKPGGVQQMLNQPARWELFIKTAQGELAQARQLAVRAEGSLDAEWTQAMHELGLELTNDQADYDLALLLERIRTDRSTWAEGSFDNRKAADEYPKAFAGLAVLNDDPVAVAARLGSSPIKDQLVAALDDWAWVAFHLRKQELVEQLLAVARQAAPDPAWGDRLRQLKVWRDREALGKLVAEAPAAGLSPQLLDLVGSLLRDDKTLKESWLRRAQAEHPADSWLSFNLASALQKTNPVEAAGFYRVALAVRSGNSAAYNNLGIALKAQGKLDEAIACYHKAIEIDPKHAIAYSNLGIALTDQKMLDEAIVAFHKAIELDPKNVKAHSALGLALAGQGKLDEAIACYRTAIELDPKYAYAHYSLGCALFDHKKSDEAIACYRRAIELDPELAETHNHLGDALKSQGKLDEAIACYRRAIELDPKDAWTHNALANALGKKGWDLANCPDPKLRDPKRAVEASKEAVELAPQSVIAWQYLGWVQYRAGNWKASIEALEESSKLEKGGDRAQWIVMSLAHSKLAIEKELPEQERDRHKTEARRWYDQVAKQIDSLGDGGNSVSEAVRAFRAEAEELLGVKEKEK